MSNKKMIHSVFEVNAKLYPGSVALRAPGRLMTYRELSYQSNQLAGLLARLGVSRSVKVGVVIPHGVELVVSLLSIFKSGGIYVPVDLSFSPKRLSIVFDKYIDSIVVTTKELVDDVLSDLRQAGCKIRYLIVINTDGKLELMEGEVISVVETSQEYVTSDFEELSSPEDGNYIFFTSGSTGEPKAILGKHISLSQFIHWEMKEFQADKSIRVSQLIQFTFDASLRDIFLPLCSCGTLCLPPAEVKMNMPKLLQWLRDEQVTLVHTVPSLFRLMTKEMALSGKRDGMELPHLKFLLLAGEPLYMKDIRRWREVAGGHVELVNLYGATETTLIRAFHRIDEIGNDDAQLIPVGIPIDNTSIAIINDGRLCGVGEVGEVHVKSPFFTKGYFGNDELTRKVFVQNPLQKDSIDIVYKTGDLGRYTKNKLIEILGRQDRQVKINGIRIELNEIEKAALSVEKVEEVFVKVHQNAANYNSLVCYYVGQLSTEELRQAFLKELNANVIPAHIIELKEFPLNLNGKVDARSLPLPESFNGVDDDYMPPDGDIERLLETMWAEVLGVKRVSRDTSFFHIGGHSLNAIQLISRIYREFNVELKLAELFTHRTIRDLSKLLSESSGTTAKGIVQVQTKSSYSLSHGQHRLWLLAQIEGASHVYNIPSVYEFQGHVDVDALHKAFDHLIDRYEILRTAFPATDGVPLQIVYTKAQSRFKLQFTDLRATSKKENVERLVQQETSRIFNLSDGPLLSAHLIQIEDENYVFVLIMHHIISDGWSMPIFVNQVIESYNQYAEGNVPEFPKLPIQYKDYAEWQINQLQQSDDHKSYWHNQFKPLPPLLEVIPDFVRPNLKTYNGANVQALLSQEQSARIYSLSKSTHSSVFMILLSAVKSLLYRYTSQQDIVVGVPVSGRDHPDLITQIGFFVNTLPLRTRFEKEVTFSEMISKVSAVALSGYDHQIYPFDLLVSELGIERDPSRMPLFDIMVDLRNETGQSSLPEMKNLSVQAVSSGQASAKFDLSFNFWEREGKMGLTLEYNSDLFETQRVNRMTEHFSMLLTEMLTHTDEPICQLSYLTLYERQMILGGSLQQDIVLPETRLHDLFREQVKRTPYLPAIVSEESTITYQELDELSDRLAISLQQVCGVTSGDLVVIMMERSISMLIGMLGILKTGAAYVPIDPELPEVRKNKLARKVNAKTILTDDQFNSESLNGKTVNKLLSLPTLDLKLKDTATAHDLAYVLFTSGSTGTPKGVMIEHRSIVSKLKTESSFYNLNNDLCTCLITNFTFDVSLLEIFLPLILGGRVVIPASASVLSPEYLATLVESNQVTMLQTTPSFLSLLLDLLPEIAWRKMASVRLLCVGGESFKNDLLIRLKQRMPSTLISNHYGPTEATIDASVMPNVSSFEVNSIGRALPDTSIYILDDQLAPIPIGVPGEICIGGVGVARGYLNDKERTNLSFRTATVANNERLYCTGDIGRWREDGTIEFFGRKDDQIKLRGYRIELSEIENAFAQCRGIKLAKVIMRKDADGTDQLIGYYTAETIVDDISVKIHLRNLLPAYMVPKYLVRMEAFVLNATGKIDREKLPKPNDQLQDNVEYTEPSTPVEVALTKLYATMLGKDKIGVNESFYMLGGDSIKAVQVASRMNALGYKLDVRDILRYPKVSELAKFVKTRERVIDQSPVVGTVPLAAIQQEFFQTQYRYPHHFNQSVMLYSAEGFNETILQNTFDKLQQHHDMLRAVFRSTTDHVDQFILPVHLPVALPLFDLKKEQDPAARITEIANAIQASISLQDGPLMKLALFKLHDGDCLLITIHHLIVDGISWRILLEDINTLYRQFSKDEEAVLPPKTDSFKEWSEKVQWYAQSDAAAQERKYWSQIHTSAVPVLTLDYSDNINSYDSVKSVSVHLNEEETALLLTGVNRRYNTQINDILLTALIKAYSQVYDHSSVSIALEGHGREALPGTDHLDISRTVGWFTSVYPVVLSIQGTKGLSDEIIAVKETIRKIPNKGVGYGILRFLTDKEEAVDNDEFTPPRISFNYLGEFTENREEKQFDILAGPLGHRQNPTEKRDYDLEINGMVSDRKLVLTFSYGKKQLSVLKMQRLQRAYYNALHEIMMHCSGSTETVLTPSDFEYTALSVEDMDSLFV